MSNFLSLLLLPVTAGLANQFLGPNTLRGYGMSLLGAAIGWTIAEVGRFYVREWRASRSHDQNLAQLAREYAERARKTKEENDKKAWETRFGNEWRGRTKLIPYGTAEEEKRRVEEFGQRGTIC